MRDAKRTRTLSTMLLLAAVTGCRPAAPPGGGGEELTSMTPQLAADLAVVRQGRILFSHHSVGQNVVNGIERLDAEAGSGHLRSVSIGEAAAIEGPVLAHGGGGRNGAPKSKIDFFAATIRGGPGLKPDLAFMKLCHVDFDPRTDVDDLFSYYRSTLESLKREHPEIQFAHVTVPLMERPAGLKTSLRRLLGLEVWEDAANVKRSEFSKRLAEGFPSDPIFDLARVEATGPDGSMSTFEYHGRIYPSLHPRNADEGGHLNLPGQRAAGSAAARFAADALKGKRSVR